MATARVHPAEAVDLHFRRIDRVLGQGRRGKGTKHGGAQRGLQDGFHGAFPRFADRIACFKGLRVAGAVLVELHFAINEREKRPIAAGINLSDLCGGTGKGAPLKPVAIQTSTSVSSVRPGCRKPGGIPPTIVYMSLSRRIFRPMMFGAEP